MKRQFFGPANMCKGNMHHGKTEARLAIVLSSFLLIFAWAGLVRAQTTSFTYQGRLTDGGTAATGTYDLQFALWDNNSGGTQIGATQTKNAVAVSGGIFTVTLDFGVSAFTGADRFLEIGVRPAGGGAFTILSPRQQISSTPYAIRTLSAASADSATSALTATNATQLGGVAASQYVQTNDSRLTDSRSPTAGSSNYIQNTTPQSGSNFNISGDGTAAGTLNGNVVNATTQYNLGGQRVLSASGNGNLFAGFLAGQVNTSGTNNVFVGPRAGRSNTIGAGNSFFGSNAGSNNVGDSSGNGNGNSFFGFDAGDHNTGSLNSFFGIGAGQLNGTGSSNSFFGANAGSGNSGSQSNFFGVNAGNNNAGGENNFFGYQAGLYHTTGSSNNFFGDSAGLGDPNNGSTGTSNNFFGYKAGFNFKAGTNNSLFGDTAGFNISMADNNSFFGKNTGVFNTTGSQNTFIGSFAGNSSSGNQVSYSTAIGNNALVGCSHCMLLGDASDSNFNVGIGITDPSPFFAKLFVEAGDRTGLFARSVTGYAVAGISTSGFGVYGSSSSTYGVYGISNSSYGVYGVSGSSYAGYFDGKIHVASVPFGSGTPVLVTPGGDIVAQGSSLRFKTNVHPFVGGLDIVRRLRPINFNWKQDGQPDIGLGAEDVAKVAPSFTFTDSKGEITGVKYDRLNILLINAVKEQQAQIENLRAQNAALSARLLGVEKALRKKAGSFRRQR